jgi:exosortase
MSRLGSNQTQPAIPHATEPVDAGFNAAGLRESRTPYASDANPSRTTLVEHDDRRSESLNGHSLISRRGLIQLVLIAAAFLWLYWDQCRRLIRYWSDDPDWSHGFLIPIFSLYFIYSRRETLARTPVRPNWLGFPVLLAAVVGYFVAVYLKFGYPQTVSLVVTITGIVLLLCGWPILKKTAFPIAFLLLALPPPVGMYREITQPLQQFAALSSSVVLEMLPNVWIERSGINMAYETADGRSGAFTVAGACSGMRSLMAFVALGLAMAYFTPRPVWHRLVIALIVVPVAVLCNVVRVVVTGGFHIYDYGQLAVGTPHVMMGLVTFMLGFAIYMGVLYVLDHLYVEERGPSEVTT